MSDLHPLPLLCKDCKYFHEYEHGLWKQEKQICNYYRKETVDLVTGDKIITGNMFAGSVRYDNNLCGVDGKFWKAKE
jgi:hypothetical protein